MPLPNTKDPILTELERICKTELAVPTSFTHADLFEANYGLDAYSSQGEASFPVCVHVANGKSKSSTTEGNNIIRKARVYLLLLTNYKSPTSDYPSVAVNDLIFQMHQLANNLKYWINKSPRSVNGGVNEWEIEDIYRKGDANLVGVGVSFEWNFDMATSGYFNRAY